MSLLEKLFEFVAIFTVTWFVLANLFMAVLNLGSVVQEKHPNRRTLFDRIDGLWKAFWRRVL